MAHQEYLVRFGLWNDLGRYRAAEPLTLSRGARVVIRTERGEELGQVVRPATERYGRWLGGEHGVGELLRVAGSDDEERAARLIEQADALLTRGGQLIAEMGIPASLLDAEILLDGKHAIVHAVRWGEADLREVVRPLSKEMALSIALTELAAPAEEAGGCGSCDSEGCGNGGCGSGGNGCSTGCGVARPEEVQAYFAELREKMERRVPLL